MDWSIPRTGNLGFFIKLIGCGLLSILTSFCYNTYLQRQWEKGKLELVCNIKCAKDVSVDLYLDYGKGFSEEQKITRKLREHDSIISFKIIKKEGFLLERMRLDFDTKSQKVLLKEISVLKDEKEWFFLGAKKILDKIKYVSGGSRPLDFEGALMIPILDKDTYISFTDSFNLATSNLLKSILLLWPWLLIGIIYIFRKVRKLATTNGFFLVIAIFIISIFLKDAWSTLSILIIGLYSIWRVIKIKRLHIQKEQQGLIIFFLFILIFGQIKSYEQINVQLGLLIVPLFIALSNTRLSKEILYTFYCKVVFVFMLLLIFSFIISVFIYAEVDFLYYIENKKRIIGNITYWLLYKNPTFLTFFILVALSMSYFLYSTKRIDSVSFLIFTVLLFINILLLGSRLALVAFIIILATRKIALKWQLFTYVIVFIGMFSYIFLNIEILDNYRFIMWETITATEVEFFGKGLGSTEQLFAEFSNEFIRDKINHPHNQFLTYYYELGIMGVFMLLGLFLYYGCLFFKSKQKESLTILFLLLLLMITESPLETTKSLYVFIFFMSLTFYKKNNEQLEYVRS